MLKSYRAGAGPGICSIWDIFQLSQEALCPVREMGVGEQECGVETCLGYTVRLQHSRGWILAWMDLPFLWHLLVTVAGDTARGWMDF